MELPNKFCHNCGTKQPSSAAKFCFSCGTSLASIDEKPPQAEPRQPLPRVQQQQETFEPMVLGARNRRRDDDEDTIRADRVESLAELGIRLNDLELTLDVPRVQREDFNNVVRSGLGLPAGYKEPARASNAPAGNDAAKIIMNEGAAIRPGSTTEIK